VFAVVGVILVILGILIVVGLVATGRAMRVVQQYEQGIVFRFGKVLPGTRGPGLHVIRPVGDRMQKVNMQIIAMAVPAQEGITRDNVSVRVDAVVYFRVVDPIKATVNVQNYMFAVSQQAQTSLRSIIGQSEMDQLLAERATVNKELRRIIDEPTEGPWGIRVERVEIKDVSLPEQMKRSMSRQAEAERERRARIITADGEYQASKRLAAAANVMARDPAALQLRLLQTVVEVAAERNSTLVMPIPVELLRFFDKFTPAAPASEKSAADSASLADFGDVAVAEAVAEAELGGVAAPPLEIPDLPPIPEIATDPADALLAGGDAAPPDAAAASAAFADAGPAVTEARPAVGDAAPADTGPADTGPAATEVIPAVDGDAPEAGGVAPAASEAVSVQAAPSRQRKAAGAQRRPASGPRRTASSRRRPAADPGPDTDTDPGPFSDPGA
jgi:regulator of protease activity HflC (stomatin/prohibitin superfamily)